MEKKKERKKDRYNKKDRQINTLIGRQFYRDLQLQLVQLPRLQTNFNQHQLQIYYPTLQYTTFPTIHYVAPNYTTLHQLHLQLQQQLLAQLQLQLQLHQTTQQQVHCSTLQLQTQLHYTTLHYIDYIALHYNSSCSCRCNYNYRCITQHNTTRRYSRLRNTIPHYTTQQYTTLRCITLLYYTTRRLQLQLLLRIHKLYYISATTPRHCSYSYKCNYNYNCATPHYMQQTTQLQVSPPVGASVLRSAIRESQQLTSPMCFLFFTLPRPPCAVMLENIVNISGNRSICNDMK